MESIPSKPDMAIEQLKLLSDFDVTFRGLVNDAHRHYSLRQKRADFNRVCSAMDIIEDITFALSSYIKHKNDDQGLAYLHIFGVLQSLCVQQDAVRMLHKVINGDCLDLEDTYEDIKEIRDIRNKVAGHPVTSKGESHFLARYTVSSGGFKFLAYDQSGARIVEEDVSLHRLINLQLKSLNKAMENLIEIMEEQDKKHKEEFKGNLLVAIFKNSTYFSSKLLEGVTNATNDRLAEDLVVGLNGLKEVVDKFFGELKSWHPVYDDFLPDDRLKLNYAFDKFESYLKSDTSINKNDAYILARFIQIEIESLESTAKEIDEKYNG